MTDQQLGVLLFPALMVIPPVTGFLLGIRREGAARRAIAALLVSIVVGVCTGAAWAAAVDLRAAAMGSASDASPSETARDRP